MDTKFKFKSFRCWPPDNYPLEGYMAPADRDEIFIPSGVHGHLNDDFADDALRCYDAMRGYLKEKFPGWESDGCDLERMFLAKEIPGDPEADEDGIVEATFVCGVVGFNFAVREVSSGRVFESDNELDLAWLEIKSFLINKFQDDFLKFEWDEDNDTEYVSCRSYQTKEARFVIHKDIYGNPTLIDERTKETFPIKIV